MSCNLYHLLVYTMAIVTSWSYCISLSEVWLLLSSLLLKVLTEHSLAFSEDFQSVQYIWFFSQVNRLATLQNSVVSSSSQVFLLLRGTAFRCPEPHVALSFWLQLLSVLLWSVSLSFCRPSCCSLACRRLDLTGRTSTTRRQRRCKQKYQDLQRHADGGNVAQSVHPFGQDWNIRTTR